MSIKIENCSICYADLKQSLVLGLECNHSFHRECMVKWIKHGHKTCPLCRRVSQIAKDILDSLPDIKPLMTDDEFIELFERWIGSHTCFQEIKDLYASGDERLKGKIDKINAQVDRMGFVETTAGDRCQKLLFQKERYESFLVRRKSKLLLESIKKSKQEQRKRLLILRNICVIHLAAHIALEIFMHRNALKTLTSSIKTA